MEVDIQQVPSAVIEEAINKSQSLAKDGKLNEAIDVLATVEKQTRLSADVAGNTKVQIQMATLCFQAGDLDELDKVLQALSKKRSILKQAVASTIQKCVQWISDISDLNRRVKLIETLRAVTEGKIYVEVERARVTKILADIYERQLNDIKKASEVMQELQVETFGSMEKREKVDFILEQIRLSVSVSEFQKALIISRKLTNKTFEQEGFDDLKLRYLELMIQITINNEKYLETCKHYKSIMNLKGIIGDEERYIYTLKMAIIFVTLSTYSKDQSELMNLLYKEKKINDIPLYREFLRTFLTKELVRWPVVEQAFGNELKSFPHIFGSDSQSALRWQYLRRRVVEHNVRTISSYYSTLTLKRFSELLELSLEDSEDILCKLVPSKMVFAKIDRTSGVIIFDKPISADEVLNSWNTQVDSLLSLMIKANHQIAKEEMIYSSMK